VRFAPIRPALLAFALGSAAVSAEPVKNAPAPQLKEVSREQSPGISLRVLELPIDADRVHIDRYFANREFIGAFRQKHLTPGWSASHGVYWLGLGFEPFQVAAAVSVDRSVFFVGKAVERGGGELALSGPQAKPYLRVCEIRFEPAAFPGQLTLATAHLLQMIAVRDGCSLKGLSDQALQAEMRAPLDFKDYQVAEQQAFPGGRKVALVEYRGRESLSWARAAGHALGVKRLAEVTLLPGGEQAVTLVRQGKGAIGFVLHKGINGAAMGSSNVCVFQGFPWPQAPKPEYSRTWPLPESDDPAVAYCLAARKRSDDRYSKALREAAEKNPPRILAVPRP
jgi:hypothetical protein